MKFTHLLIAGTTGSGKSFLINRIMDGLPDGTLTIYIDPKRVDLWERRTEKRCIFYADDIRTASAALIGCVHHMDERYKKVRRGIHPGPPLYIVLDELADLMMTDKKSIMPPLTKLLMLGRAANFHVIAATQIPNRKVLPAELVLNFTDRIALRCLSQIESRQIIGTSGAELLPRYGEGLYLSSDGLKRIKIT